MIFTVHTADMVETSCGMVPEKEMNTTRSENYKKICA
jgi:hypothetical protein